MKSFNIITTTAKTTYRNYWWFKSSSY